MSDRSMYYAVIRKDGNKWAADLYKEQKVFIKSWFYNFRTKTALVTEINSMGVKIN